MIDSDRCRCGYFRPGPLHGRECNHYNDYIERLVKSQKQGDLEALAAEIAKNVCDKLEAEYPLIKNYLSQVTKSIYEGLKDDDTSK